MANLPRAADTIVAIATAPGRGGIGVVRLSGPQSLPIARSLGCTDIVPRQAHFVRLRDRQGELLDEAIVIAYTAPRSFTGEDVVELQCHGSPVVLRELVAECVAFGARHAEPGEFSQRAFLNGRIDLLQAEAIADLISSSSESAARSALRSLSGVFSERVGDLLQQLIELRVFVEAAIDFPEEEIDFIADSDVGLRLTRLIASVEQTLQAARRGRVLHDGIKLVLAGVPNAGKSSLLNCLAENDSAIVTPIPGTTRDLLREHIHIDGLPLHIVDTAGLRDSSDPIEQEGIRRARTEMASADRILLVIDDSGPDRSCGAAQLLQRYGDALPQNIPVTVLRNKCDLSGEEPRIDVDGNSHSLWLSATTGAGLDLLRRHLLDCAGLGGDAHNDFSARQRHVDALQTTADHLEQARQQLLVSGAAELLAEDLRSAQDRLATITGEFTSDDLLGEIFSSFCIGK
jgi:tRNA modification GTPase